MFTEKPAEGAVSVSLTASAFDKDTYVVRVARNAVNLDNIVSDIIANYPSLDPYVINHAVELVKDQIIKYLKEGRAVDVLELGTLYPAAKGTVSRTNPQVSSLPDLTLRFKPSKQALSALSAVKPVSFMVRSPEPEISRVISLKDGSEDGSLYRGFPVRVEGSKLKIAGEAGGIFFVPLDSDGEPDRDEASWIAADTSYLLRNVPKTLEFNLPDAAEEGKSYFLAVRTAYSPSGRIRKEPLTGFSPSAVRVLSS